MKILKFFSFTLPFGALASPIAVTVPQHLLSKSPLIHHYFFRLPLFSQTNKNNQELILEDKTRLEGYYKKYYNHQTSVNSISDFGSSKVEGGSNPNLTIHIQRKDYLEAREWEWLNAIRLNQITVDRWYEKKASDTDLITEEHQFKDLIQVEHLLPEYTKLARNALNQDAIDLYFKTAQIPTSEIKKLVYFPSDLTGQKNWYVWWDKDLLRLKLNFGFQIWLFNQKPLNKYKFVKSYFEQKKPQEKKKLQEQLNTLYKSLTQEEKDFFEFYFEEVWIKKGNNHDWDDATWNVMEFKSRDLNKMYNLLSEKSKSLGIFKGHLIQVLKGGDKEAFESFFPNYINYAAGPDAVHDLKGGDGYKPDIKLTITPNKLLDNDWNVQVIIDWIKYYSIKNFTLKTSDDSKEQWPAIIFNPKTSGFPIIRENYLSQKAND